MRDLYVAAALLPVLPAVASLVGAMEPGAWAVDGALVRGVTPDAILYSAVCVVVAAPLAGVAVASARRDPSEARGPAASDAWRLAGATLVFCTVSALLTVARLGLSSETASFVWRSHAVLASVTLALTGLGALFGAWLRNPLDAAACSLVLSATAGYGLLVAGAPVGDAPRAVVDAALLASPIVTVASAAHVDIVRSDIWYQISPLAHTQLDYPAWGVACGSYVAAGGAAFLAVAFRRSQGAGRHGRQR